MKKLIILYNDQLSMSISSLSGVDKSDLVSSRINPTKAIVSYIKDIKSKPILINASAIGYYTNTDNIQTESAKNNDIQSFTHKLVNQWEQEANRAQTHNAQVCCLRFGIVLGKSGGMIKKVRPLFKLGLGSVMGYPNYHMSWIHINDLCRAILFIIKSDHKKNIYNFTSPSPCTQKEFAQAMAASCRRPLLFSVPAFLIKCIFGEMGEALLLANQKIYPEALTQSGFEFKFTDIESALRNIND